MGFPSGIRGWLDEARKISILYKIHRRNPGDITAVIDKLNASELALLKYEIGNAITAWAIMEERLILVASLLLKGTPQKTGLVFYSIINFNVWLAIITDLFPLEPDLTTFQHRWNKISERLRAE
jgi:hypothetical protein